MGGYVSHSTHEPTEALQASCGPIRGNVYRQKDGRFVDAYLGIPYAKPLTKDTQFKKPEMNEKWSELRDCFEYGPRCPQDDSFPEAVGSINAVRKDAANCLVLNVFAPRWKSDQWKNGLPVLVYIHGGGFEMHSSSEYCPASLAATLCVKGVVVVSFNYRLGVYGFFSTGDDVCKGNLGLWDQTMALKWIQHHISSFGGDPKNVTIFGQSAGGASVDLLALSPHSRDLFQRGILMSGCVDCPFGMRTREQHARLCREYADFLGFPGGSSQDMIKWLTEQPQEELGVGWSPKKGFSTESVAGQLMFLPNMDGDFYPRPIEELRREMPKKEWIAGTVECEGLIAVGPTPGVSLTKEQMMWKKINSDFKSCDFGDQAAEIRQKIFDFYTKGVDKSDDKQMLTQLALLYGDDLFCVGTQKYVQKMCELGHDVYFYSFDYCNPDALGFFQHVVPFTAAMHCSELPYLLGTNLMTKFEPNEEDLRMVENFTSWFCNFAKYGNPNSKGSQAWEKYDGTRFGRYFSMRLPISKMLDNYQQNRPSFWNEIHMHNRSRKFLDSGLNSLI